MWRGTAVLALFLASGVEAEGQQARLLELYRTGRLAEAVVLVRSLIAEYPEPTHLQAIATSAEATEMLRLPEWPSIQESYFARLDQVVAERHDIPYEFECRAIKEQWARFAYTANPKGPSYTDLDIQNTARLKQVVAEQGWPRESVWGKGPAQAAWILLQHTPDYEFQAQMLPVLEKLLPEQECSPAGYALLYDRVQLRHGHAQRYGSQVRKVAERWEPVPPLEDPDRLDALRAEMGLQPMAEYLKTIAKMYDLPKARGWFH